MQTNQPTQNAHGRPRRATVQLTPVRHYLVAFMLTLMAASCGAPDDVDQVAEAKPGEIDVHEQALAGGTPISTEEYSGVVAIQVYSQTLQSSIRSAQGPW